MANIHTDLMAELVSVPLVTELCGDRVRFVTNKFELFPAMTLQRVNDAQSFQFGNTFSMQELSYQVDIYAKSYENLVDLEVAVIEYFRGFTGPLNGNDNSFVKMCNCSLTVETFEDPKPDLLRAILDITLTAN